MVGSAVSLMRFFMPIAIDKKTWNRAIGTETGVSKVDVRFDGSGYTVSQNFPKRAGLMPYGFGPSTDSIKETNSDVSVSASKRLGKGMVEMARLLSLKTDVARAWCGGLSA